ncbi:MAG: formylglycine-generating enzyme family protein [Ktedonobacteraceae bacterium]
MNNADGLTPGMIMVKAFIQDIFNPLATDPQQSVDWQSVCDWLKQIAPLLDESALDELIGAVALHPAPEARKVMIDVLLPQLSDIPSVQQFLIWCLRDADEQVALAAIRACASTQDEVFWPELYALLGRAPARVKVNQMLAPMSLREAAARQALLQFQREGLPIRFEQLDPLLMKGLGEEVLILNREVDTADMVRVEAGRFVSGLNDLQNIPGWFALDDVMPAHLLELKEYYIDRDSVTNEEYDAFCEAVEDQGHLWCHPDETPGKYHRRSTWGDSRVETNHPVCGVDWYDAFAYASWRGKSLPTAEQWEKAARGTDGRVYPWGDTYDPDRVNDADRAYGRVLQSLEALLGAQASFSSKEPQCLTVPTDKLAANVSPYGVRGMIGNVWEWTKSRYLDDEDMTPHFCGLEPATAMEDWSSWTTVKGGAWSSKAELLLPAYRGRRHILFRSPDVGFRCVYEP